MEEKIKSQMFDCHLGHDFSSTFSHTAVAFPFYVFFRILLSIVIFFYSVPLAGCFQEIDFSDIV